MGAVQCSGNDITATDEEKFRPRFRGYGNKILSEGSPRSLSSVNKSEKKSVGQTPDVQERLQDLDIKRSYRTSSSSEIQQQYSPGKYPKVFTPSTAIKHNHQCLKIHVRKDYSQAQPS
ncbi:hypothetical protein TNCV_3135391 [Trichonephila clavipes]|nr:hypothetical protein TNCV_3135391 [Trichonephila clavipes]